MGDLFCAPGNAGMEEIARCVQVDWKDTAVVVDFCYDRNIALVVIGPEAPLAAGLSDTLRDAGFRVVGPSREAAKLESSKAFTREVCEEMEIPSPRSMNFTGSEQAKAKSYVEANFQEDEKIVVKADGLAAGKGVVIASSRGEAYEVIDEMFDGKFGEASACVLIEECLEGEEASLFYLCDGEVALALGSGRDYKRIGDGNVGANTGGMGAYSPVEELTGEICAQVEEKIVNPALHSMVLRGTPFAGFLYAGVMLTSSGVKLLEFNVRLGDPETQVVLPRLQSNFLQLLLTSCSGAGALRDVSLEWDSRSCVTVVMASRGYPGKYKTGERIEGIRSANSMRDIQVFHAGTDRDSDGGILASGGRVLAVSGLGESLVSARSRAYEAVRHIEWSGGIYRRDIGI